MTDTIRRVTASPGGAEVIAVTTGALRGPFSNETVVRVSAFSMNRGELNRARNAETADMQIGWDFAGTVETAAADGSGPAAGTRVVGFSTRMEAWAELVSIPTTHIAPIPEAVSNAEAATLPVAGLTALHSIDAASALIGRKALITGATGGVGSTAVDILSNLGYEVVASTGKPDAADWLTDLGASSIIDRAELSEEGKRPLESTLWAGAVDCVGGTTLANVLKKIHYGGSVAASGLTGGPGLATTVLPFILRGVNLLGIDSVEMPMERRRQAWNRIGTDLKPSNLDTIGHDIGLADLDTTLTDILAGNARGRSVVDLRA